LYAGTELGLYVSYTAGNNWTELNLKNLPHVAVHDILIHPRENDIILATHGRSIWILDDATPIQQTTPQVLSSDMFLFDVRPALRYTSRFTRYGIGSKVFTGANPPYGALISYYLKDKPDEKTTVKIQILDERGKVVQTLENLTKEKGLNRASWNLRYGGAQVRRPPTDEETAFGGGPRGPQVLPGTYTVRLQVGDKTQDKRVEVRLDPTISVPAADLQLEHDMTLKLRDMQSTTNTALRTLDSLKTQLEFVEKTVKDRLTDVPKELSDKLAESKKQVEAAQNRLAQPEGGLGFSGRSQLSDRIGGLFFTIDGANAAPTPAQREYYGELQIEFNEKIAEVNKFLNQSVAQLNETLRKFNAPQLMVGKPLEMPPQP
jgi:RNase H-fold protein (predicted Holliday junction resolvase)